MLVLILNLKSKFTNKLEKEHRAYDAEGTVTQLQQN